MLGPFLAGALRLIGGGSHQEGSRRDRHQLQSHALRQRFPKAPGVDQPALDLPGGTGTSKGGRFQWAEMAAIGSFGQRWSPGLRVMGSTFGSGGPLLWREDRRCSRRIRISGGECGFRLTERNPQPPMQRLLIRAPQLEAFLAQGEFLLIHGGQGRAGCRQDGRQGLEGLLIAAELLGVCAEGLQHLGFDRLRGGLRQGQFPLRVVKQGPPGRRDHTALLPNALLHLLPVGHRGVAPHLAHHDPMAFPGGNALGRHRGSRLHHPAAHVGVQVFRIHETPLLPIRRPGADALHQETGGHREVVAALERTGGFDRVGRGEHRPAPTPPSAARGSPPHGGSGAAQRPSA